MTLLSNLRRGGLVVAVLVILAGCGDDDTSAGPPTPAASATASRTQTQPVATQTETETAAPTATSTPSATITPSATRTPPDPLSGGATTVHNASRNAFAIPAPNLDAERKGDFFVGNALFNRNWVTAPASTDGLDGLGPVFNARSCSSCHFRDGRGRPPTDENDSDPSLLFRLSLPGVRENGGPLPDPRYGDQLGPQSILGVAAEGRVAIGHTEVPVVLADGEEIVLLRPEYTFADLAFGPLEAETMVSGRVAPFLIGLGLLEALDEETILARADENDADGDGISGRANWVWDERAEAVALGRFGWKANQPTLEQQNAGAFLGDIGITSELFPVQNCTEIQSACSAAIDGGDPELDPEKLDLVTFYTHTLAVPARRDIDDAEALAGEALFARIGCASCHLPDLTTGERPGIPEVSGQRIHPYTDLLLHDLGEELADGRPDFLASGREWRTPPLWGIGLVEVVNRHTNFLHDGRARNLTEAILWHGGEAEKTRDAFSALSGAERAAVLRFLESL